MMISLSEFISFLYNLFQMRFVQVVNNRECQNNTEQGTKDAVLIL